MRLTLYILMLAILCNTYSPTSALAQQTQVNQSLTENEVLTLPGSKKRYRQKDIDNFYDAPDWYPESHPTMPDIVRLGSKPKIRACGTCHLTSGVGRPESAMISGFSEAYIYRQLLAYQELDRPGVMLHVARGLTEQQRREAAAYFSSLPTMDIQEVIEVDEVPVSYINQTFMRVLDPDALSKQESIGDRIITLPLDEYRMKVRDPTARYITYVPKGYLARGKSISIKGSGSSPACISCHGKNLQGIDKAPNIAGQYPLYLIKQLRDFKEAIRRGSADDYQLMSSAVKYLSEQDILAVAAYAASLPR